MGEEGKSYLSIIIKILLTFQIPSLHSEKCCSNKRPSCVVMPKVSVPPTRRQQVWGKARGRVGLNQRALLASLSMKQLNSKSPLLAGTIR